MYRRETEAHPTADFFDPENPIGIAARQVAAEKAVADMTNWLKSGGSVAILDATNSTTARRRWVYSEAKKVGADPLFVESWTEDADLVAHNIAAVKTGSPDYKDSDPSAAAKDFADRIARYEKVYEPMGKSPEESEYAYVRLINVNAQVVINRIGCYLQSRIVYYLMNLRAKQPRAIWLSRHGESLYNLTGKLGGDSDLSERGDTYARRLPELVKTALQGDSGQEQQQQDGDGEEGIPRNLTVWTSTLRRTQQTARFLPFRQLQWKALDELDAGMCDGMTYKDIEREYPEDFKARDRDKFHYRYRGGESYQDVVARLEPIIMELERQDDILIVTHQAVLRCIYAYFMNVPQDRSPWMDVPLHTLIKLEPGPYGTQETRIPANIPAVSTYREKGQSALSDEK